MDKGIETERPAMLTTKQVALMIGVSRQTLWSWRRTGEGPLAVELPSGHVRYPTVIVEQWLAARAA